MNLKLINRHARINTCIFLIKKKTNPIQTVFVYLESRDV